MLIYNIRLIDNINLVQENIVLDVIVRGNNNFNYMSSVICIVDKGIYEKDNWNRKRSVVLYRVNKSNKIRGW
jgi:hypothetical protein